MPSSVFLSNCFFCSIIIALLIYVVRKPTFLNYKRGFFLFFVLIVVLFRLVFPFEFPFTQTIPSENVLPFVYDAISIRTINPIVKNVLLSIWFLVSTYLIIDIFIKSRKVKKIFYNCKPTKNSKLIKLVNKICELENIKKEPEIIELDIFYTPTIIGLLKPRIVIPKDIPEASLEYILWHELIHLKNYHIPIKFSMDIITAIYWWNPIIWLLRKATIQTLELQVDSYILKHSSKKEQMSYLTVLIQMAKKQFKHVESSYSLSFINERSFVSQRIKFLYNYSNTMSLKTSVKLSDVIALFLAIALLIFSFIYTFEYSDINPALDEITSVVDLDTSYFEITKDGEYDLYLDGDYVTTMPDIPENLKIIPVRKLRP